MKFFLPFILLFIATWTSLSQEVQNLENFPDQNEKLHSFYLIGDLGADSSADSFPTLSALGELLQSREEMDVKGKKSLIFLGDNATRELELKWHGALNKLENRTEMSVFVPGENEWTLGIDGLKEIENDLEDVLVKDKLVIPNPGCAFKFVDISKDVHLIVLDSQWFLEDWDEHPLINDDCPEIKSRAAFFEEFETELKKNQNKTTIVALHHPLISNGIHGGRFGWSSYLNPEEKKLPIPVVGQIMNLLRTSGGTSYQDSNNPLYSSFVDRIETIANKWGRVVFVSGHDHSLQYLEKDHLRQIVSGSGAKSSYVRSGGNGLFSEDLRGFAVLDVFQDGSSQVRFYRGKTGEPKLLYHKELFPHLPEYSTDTLSKSFPLTIKASVYNPGETEKTGFYKTLWGERYRRLYEKQIEVPVADLDTLYGGLTAMRMGGGNQTNSVRVKDSLNREYNFRMLRKDAVQFLQATAYKDKVIEKAFEDTFAEEMIQDFYTASHPFAFLAVPTLADAVGVLHTNPEIYYLPRQQALGDYNSAHGDEIYMIEERPEENWLGHESFGSPNHDIQSTAGMFDRLRRDEKYKLDEEAYIRARIFDMLIGDWDRHNDQWRWAEIEQENGGRIFKPIPRDRDQVFSNFDGSVFNNLRGIIGFLNQFGRYDEDIADVEWFNRSAANLDRALVQNSGREEWLEQAKIIQNNMTDQVIAEAFERLPKEAQGETTEEIIRKLKGRTANLVDIVERYYEILAELAIMTGTDKDEYIDVKRLPDGNTQVIIYRNKNGERDEIVNQKIFRKDETKEVWVYGLDDEDEFSVDGTGPAEIDVKLIGGQNNDTYKLERGDKIKVYDYRSKSNKIEENSGGTVFLTDNYDINVFNKNLKISDKNSLLPFVGFNPDDGIILGFRNTYTVNNLVRKPFTSRHEIGGEYFFATHGFEVSYRGEFAHAERKFNLTVGAYFSSPRNTTNYFGIGNETPNFTEELSKDYNRVRVSALGGEVGLIRRSPYGSRFSVKALVEGLEVENTPDRVITDVFKEGHEIFSRNYFGGIEGNYSYVSLNSRTNPSKGLTIDLNFGGKTEFQDVSQTFLFVNPFLELFTPLTADEKLVLNPRVMAELNFLDNFRFYHAATLGGDNGLRSFRHERFTGTKAFAAGSDLRYSFNTIRNNFLPVQIGILGGYDLGRVWAQNHDSTVWHQSYGGGLWITMARAAAAELSLFHGVEGFRFSFGFRFGL
ncbi:phosphoesterase [Salinimicrobium sediminilitoris]|uniref:phosphoesterase n=1 Tax=Salinimicrobium sediminilitoris TaxID=2876715 RepID=UPI001E3FD7A5|nr:phosphoesterase [Salinimicrobium sediminilitoris]MCC8358936.1 phosphoesterase [Salinimicrobium sediminilitoris]